jgi:small subunit ribosomal protein S17e
MGQIRQNSIKNACKLILKMYPNEVTKDFQKNKELVQRVTDVESKMLRNQIAGYLVTLKGKEGRLIMPPKKQRKMRNKNDRVKKQRRKWIAQ